MLVEIKKTTCLRHSIKSLNLTSVYLKHLDTENIPRLTTIYEFNSIIENAYQQIDNIEKALPVNNSEFALKGMFTLVVTQFEILLLDLISKILKFYPEKLDRLSRKESDFGDLQFTYLGLEKSIDFKVHRLGYKSIEDILKKLLMLLDEKHNKISLFDGEILDQIVEIKETRNLLLHNNLVINQFYLNNTKTIKRSDKKGEKLMIDTNYLYNSIKTIKSIIEAIQLKVIEKYKKHTLIELFKRLWEFTFTNKHFVTIEKFCTLNYHDDTIDGPFEIDEKYSSSEKLYMEFWKAQRTSTKLESPFSMVNLNTGSKLSLLADVFGELRMTYW
jgi:hypothetical protein